MLLDGKDRRKIRAIAAHVRERVVALANDKSIPYHPSTLMGLCGIAADGVTRSLLCAGFSATNVFGHFSPLVHGDHCWTEVDVPGSSSETVVVDVTATQFEVLVRTHGVPIRIRPVTVLHSPAIFLHKKLNIYGWSPKIRGSGFDRALRGWGEEYRAATYRKLRWWEDREEEKLK